MQRIVALHRCARAMKDGSWRVCVRARNALHWNGATWARAPAAIGPTHATMRFSPWASRSFPVRPIPSFAATRHTRPGRPPGELAVGVSHALVFAPVRRSQDRRVGLCGSGRGRHGGDGRDRGAFHRGSAAPPGDHQAGGDVGLASAAARASAPSLLHRQLSQLPRALRTADPHRLLPSP